MDIKQGMNRLISALIIAAVQCQQAQQGQQQQNQQNQQQQGGEGMGVQPGAWNGSLLDNLNNQFQLRNVSLLLRSYCGQEIQRVLNNRTDNLTFFAPSDTSFGRFLDMSNQMGAAEFNCSTQGTNGSQIAQYCDPNSWPMNLQNVSFYNVSACSPLVLQYHVVPGQALNLTQMQQQSSQQGGAGQQKGGTAGGAIGGAAQRTGQAVGGAVQGGQQRAGGLFNRFQRQFGGQQQQSAQQVNTLNVTVLHTMLNDTRFVNLPQNQSQVLILNQTDAGFFLRHGAWPESQVRVNESIRGVNGIAYIIDGPLFPPMNLTRSLEMLNLTTFASALPQIASQQKQSSVQSRLNQFVACQNQQGGAAGQQQSGSQQQAGGSQQQQQNSVDQMQGITVFAPIESVMQGGGGQQSFNASSYIIPNHVIYNNGTSLNQTAFQALDGNSYNITVGSNYTMQFGNATVIESNILLSNGVLHIIDGLVQSGAQTQGAAGGQQSGAQA